MQSDELVHLVTAWHSRIFKAETQHQQLDNAQSSSSFRKQIQDAGFGHRPGIAPKGLSATKHPLLMVPQAKREYNNLDQPRPSTAVRVDAQTSSKYSVQSKCEQKQASKERVSVDKGALDTEKNTQAENLGQNKGLKKESSTKTPQSTAEGNMMWKRKLIRAFINQPMLQGDEDFGTTQAKAKDMLKRVTPASSVKIFAKVMSKQPAIHEENLDDSVISVKASEKSLDEDNSKEPRPDKLEPFKKSYRNFVLSHLLKTKRLSSKRGAENDDDNECEDTSDEEDLFVKRTRMSCSSVRLDVKVSKIQVKNETVATTDKEFVYTLDLNSKTESRVVVPHTETRPKELIDKDNTVEYQGLDIRNNQLFTTKIVHAMSSTGNNSSYLDLDAAFRENSLKAYKLLCSEIITLEKRYDKAYKTYLTVTGILDN